MSDSIDSYRPTLASERWAPIAAFVREAVRDATPKTKYTARNLLATVTGFVDWCVRVRGISLNRSKIFRPNLIAEYVAFELQNVVRS
ncbi:MAG: hypothetical protein ACK5LJ_07035, partial [Paracoccus sp. (in: a-proteobacteria)]